MAWVRVYDFSTVVIPPFPVYDTSHFRLHQYLVLLFQFIIGSGKQACTTIFISDRQVLHCTLVVGTENIITGKTQRDFACSGIKLAEYFTGRKPPCLRQNSKNLPVRGITVKTSTFEVQRLKPRRLRYIVKNLDV